MINVIVILLSLMFSTESSSESTSGYEDQNAVFSTSELKVVDFNELQDYLKSKDSKKTYVINFWATWCAPCVKELPYFEKLNAKYNDADVEVMLVSLDFPKHLETKLIPFIEKNDLKSEVILLDDVDANTWIPKVDKNWSGSIPATIIYNKNKRIFYERSFDFQELETELQQFIK